MIPNLKKPFEKDAHCRVCHCEIEDGVKNNRSLSNQALAQEGHYNLPSFRDVRKSAVYQKILGKNLKSLDNHPLAHTIISAVLDGFHNGLNRKPIDATSPANGNWMVEIMVVLTQHMMNNVGTGQQVDREDFLDGVNKFQEHALKKHNERLSVAWSLADQSDPSQGPVSTFQLIWENQFGDYFNNVDEKNLDLPNEGDVNKWGEEFSRAQPINNLDTITIYWALMCLFHKMSQEFERKFPKIKSTSPQSTIRAAQKRFFANYSFEKVFKNLPDVDGLRSIMADVNRHVERVSPVLQAESPLDVLEPFAGGNKKRIFGLPKFYNS